MSSSLSSFFSSFFFSQAGFGFPSGSFYLGGSTKAITGFGLSSHSPLSVQWRPGVQSAPEKHLLGPKIFNFSSQSLFGGRMSEHGGSAAGQASQDPF